MAIALQGSMSTEHQETSAQDKAHSGAQSNGSSHATQTARAYGGEVARRAKAFLSELPVNAREQMKRNPYQALGIASAVGLAVGVVFSSRILRTALASAASVVLIDLARNSFREQRNGIDTHLGDSAKPLRRGVQE